METYIYLYFLPKPSYQKSKGEQGEHLTLQGGTEGERGPERTRSVTRWKRDWQVEKQGKQGRGQVRVLNGTVPFPQPMIVNLPVPVVGLRAGVGATV